MRGNGTQCIESLQDKTRDSVWKEGRHQLCSPEREQTEQVNEYKVHPKDQNRGGVLPNESYILSSCSPSGTEGKKNKFIIKNSDLFLLMIMSTVGSSSSWWCSRTRGRIISWVNPKITEFDISKYQFQNLGEGVRVS